MANIVAIVTVIGSLAALALWLFKRFYSPPPNSLKLYNLRKKLKQSRADIANEIMELKSKPALKRDYTHFDELLAKRDSLLEEIELLQKS